MNGNLLEMSGITKVFVGVRALNNVHFELEKGKIHAVVGENGAGKSTLMKILIGLHSPDKGTIRYRGKKVQFKSARDALNSGISMIHQEISLIQGMDVAENLWLGRENLFTTAGILNLSKRYAKTQEVLSQLNIRVNPKAMVSSLSVAEMQLVELARAVSHNAEIIIMDEPTSALTAREIDLLYSIARSLSAKGVSIIFISHKIEEVYKICERATVLRDGSYIDTVVCADTPKDQLIKMIVGREIKDRFVKQKSAISDVKLEVRNLTSAGVFRDISFTVHRGEVLGFYGLMGSGRTEIMRAIFGIDNYTSGEVLIDGKPVRIKSPRIAVKHGIGMITEDRLRLGVIYTLPVIANATLAAFKKICNRLALFAKKKELAIFKGIASTLSVKYASPDDLIGQLSGGNQQKVLVGRWLLTDPRILILDEPTRGIDVGAKMEIHAVIDRLAQEGMAILLVSSELPEILATTDRVIVVNKGRVAFERNTKETDEVTLVSYAFGHLNNSEKRNA